MRQTWNEPPDTSDDLDEWYVYVAIYDDVGMPSPAAWINLWLRKHIIQYYPLTVVHAINAFIVRHHKPRQLYIYQE